MVSAWSVSSARTATIRLPRHASRGWSRVGTWLPCTDRWSVIPFYWAAAALKRPERDRFVISIDHVPSMPPGGWPRRSARAEHCPNRTDHLLPSGGDIDHVMTVPADD
jgi:hypothetical protein